MPHRVAFLGFSEFERQALVSYFRLSQNRSPAYEQVPTLTDADFLVADADHGPSVQLVLAIERLGATVFIGSQAPEGCSAWMMRPIDALRVMRELDGLVANAQGARLPPPAPAEVDPLTLRDPKPAVAAIEPGHFPTDDSLVAHEPPLPLTRPPVVEPEWLLELPAAPVPSAPSAAPAPPVTAPAPALARPSAAMVIPTLTVALAEPQAARPVRPPRPQRVPLMPPTPRVLLVDDSPIALRFLEVRLGAWQLEVDRAATSQAAIALLAQHSYDVVFLDIELGPASELDGLMLCQRIKRTPALLGAMVILISAHHSELDRVRGALAGCDAYLGKPLEMRELQRLMEHQGVRAASSEGAPAP